MNTKVHIRVHISYTLTEKIFPFVVEHSNKYILLDLQVLKSVIWDYDKKRFNLLDLSNHFCANKYTTLLFKFDTDDFNTSYTNV